MVRCDESPDVPFPAVVIGVTWCSRYNQHEYVVREEGGFVSDGYTEGWLTPADSDVVRLNEPTKQGEAHPALTTLEEMANMPGVGNDMDLWNRHSCAVLEMARELAEAKHDISRIKRKWNSDQKLLFAAVHLLNKNGIDCSSTKLIDSSRELASANALIQEAKKALEHVHIQFSGQLPDENCGCEGCVFLAPIVETLAKLKGRAEQ